MLMGVDMYRTAVKKILSGRSNNGPNQRIVRVLSERGAMSASQISSYTGLAKSTVSTALSGLRGDGIVIENDNGFAGRNGGVGRPARKLTLNPIAGTCVGVAIGLGQIRVMVADVAHTVISDEYVWVDPDCSPAEAAETTRELVVQAYDKHDLPMAGLLGVGIAVAGPVNPITGQIQRASAVPTWAGTDLREVFGPVLQQPIFADNESNCSALAEMLWGAARGHNDFVLFKIDLGVGGSIVRNGEIIAGISGGAGEFGHITIDPDGRLCRCGNRGCLELYAGFKAAVEQASVRFGRQMSIDDIVDMAKDGDVGCRRLIEDTAINAGRGLAIVGTVLNPELIVIAGRAALAGDLLVKPLLNSYEKHTLVKRDDTTGAASTQIKVGELTENDACLGALGLVLGHRGRLA